MKPIHNRFRWSARLVVASAFCLALATHAADKPATAPAKPAKAATNAAPVQVEPAKSVFIMPANPQEGKDPFFPKSTRLFNTVVVATTTTSTNHPVVVPVDLQLKGISGVAEHRLAIIGTRTFEVGEERILGTSSGRIRVRCLDITTDSVLIQVGDEQRILHLRPGI